MSGKRILFVVDRLYRPDAHGGIESSTHDLCLTLKAQGHVPAVLSSLKPGTGLFYRNRFIARLLGLKAPGDTVNSYKTYRTWILRNAIKEVVERFRPDVVICNQVGKFIEIAAAFRAAGIPTFIYFRDTMLSAGKYDVGALRDFALIANSTYTKEFLLRDFGLDSEVIPPLILSDGRIAGTRGNHVTIIGVHPFKGVLEAIEMAKRLPHVPFLFVRSWGSPDPDILRAITALSNATYMEPVDDVRLIYGRTRILLVPSTWIEAWGRVVIEAQLNGIPVIASDRGGLVESVGYGGINLPPDDIDAWCEAIEALYGDEERYRALSQKALERVKAPDVDPALLIGKLMALAFPKGA